MNHLGFACFVLWLFKLTKAHAQNTNPNEYCDSFGICYSSFTNSQNITYGIAIPEVDSAPFDAILQIVAPVQNQWAAIAWGGQMTYNPLTVAWPNGNSVVVSSRMATGLNLPQPYNGAEYTYLRGTGVNNTHWTLTVRCRGCSSWLYGDTRNSLNPLNSSRFAWAQSATLVLDPPSNTSAFQPHDNFGHWSHDLNAARSNQFDLWVSDNILPTSTPSLTSFPASPPASSITTVSTTTAAAGGNSTTLPTACSGVSEPAFRFRLANGWQARKVAGGLTTPRGIVLDSHGRLLIVENGRGISQHTLSTDGCVESSRMLISQNDLNHGIYLSPDGLTLYTSSMTTVWSWGYDPASGNVSETRSVLVTGMSSGGHVTRTLVVPPHRPDLLVVSLGSNGNLDYGSLNPAVARAVVKVFDVSAVPEGGYNYSSDGHLAGYGLRNEVALTFDGNNMLWGVENGADSLIRTINGTITDIHIDNPADELNYLGDVTQPNNDWYGYPTCHTVWSPDSITDRSFAVGDQFVLAPNATFDDETCIELSVPPRLSFQAHSAPLDAKFDSDYSNLYITLHGSWNRRPATGYSLVVVPYRQRENDGGYEPVAAANSGEGYQNIFWHEDVSQCSATQCARPVGLVFVSDRRLYMTSDASLDGELFMLERLL